MRLLLLPCIFACPTPSTLNGKVTCNPFKNADFELHYGASGSSYTFCGVNLKGSGWVSVGNGDGMNYNSTAVVAGIGTEGNKDVYAYLFGLTESGADYTDEPGTGGQSNSFKASGITVEIVGGNRQVCYTVGADKLAGPPASTCIIWAVHPTADNTKGTKHSARGILRLDTTKGTATQGCWRTGPRPFKPTHASNGAPSNWKELEKLPLGSTVSTSSGGGDPDASVPPEGNDATGGEGSGSTPSASPGLSIGAIVGIVCVVLVVIIGVVIAGYYGTQNKSSPPPLPAQNTRRHGIRRRR